MSSQLTKKEHQHLKNIARRWEKNQLTAEALQQEIQEELGDNWNAKETDIRKELDRLVSSAEKVWWKQTWLKGIALMIVTVAVIGSLIGTTFTLLKLNPQVDEISNGLGTTESRLAMIEATSTVEQTATPVPSPTGVNIAPVSTQVSEIYRQIGTLKTQVATLSAHNITLSTTVSHLSALSITPTPTVTVTDITATISVTSTFIGVQFPVTETEKTLTLSISSGASQRFGVTQSFSTAFQLQPDTTYTLTLQSEKYAILDLTSEGGVVKSVGPLSATVVFTSTQPLSLSLFLREQLSLGVRGEVNALALNLRNDPSTIAMVLS